MMMGPATLAFLAFSLTVILIFLGFRYRTTSFHHELASIPSVVGMQGGFSTGLVIALLLQLPFLTALWLAMILSIGLTIIAALPFGSRALLEGSMSGMMGGMMGAMTGAMIPQHQYQLTLHLFLILHLGIHFIILHILARVIHENMKASSVLIRLFRHPSYVMTTMLATMMLYTIFF